jgi:hypothetical protein
MYREKYRGTVVSRQGSSAVDVELSGEDDVRSSFLIYNEPGSSNCFIKLGGVATVIDYSFILPGGYMVDAACLENDRIWTGSIHAIWDGVIGAVQMTEITQ